MSRIFARDTSTSKEMFLPPPQTSGRGCLMPCLEQQTPARLRRLTTGEGTRTEEPTRETLIKFSIFH